MPVPPGEMWETSGSQLGKTTYLIVFKIVGLFFNCVTLVAYFININENDQNSVCRF